MSDQGWSLRRAAVLAIGLVFVMAAVGLADYYYAGDCSSPYDTVQVGPDTELQTVRFCGRTYDAANDESTWYYSVTSSSKHALSHWDLGLCPPPSPAGHEVVAAGPGVIVVGIDPHTYIYGIKWDSEFGDGETKLCWVTLKGNWEVDDVQVGIKAATNVYGKDPRIYILGPSCNPFVPPPPHVEVSADWDATLNVDQPMIAEWAADPIQFTQSFGNLKVDVDATACYALNICYTYTVAPMTSDLSVSSGDMPLSFEYPTGNGTWIPIPCEGAPVSLPKPSGIGTNISHTYPIRIDLALLEIGDLTAGDSITFMLHVNVADGTL